MFDKPKFCGKCGSVLSIRDIEFCTNCGQEIEPKKNKKENDNINKNSLFPKKIGIVFLENLEKRKKMKPHLNFNQDAASYVIVQMNSIQSLFNFNIINMFRKNNPILKNENIRERFYEGITQYEDQPNKEQIDYWILITSEQIGLNYFFMTNYVPKIKKIVSIITDSNWEKRFSPPSLFEYLAMSVLTCSLEGLSIEYTGEYKSHETLTRGCIFDFTEWKPHNRIGVANPQICFECKEKIRIIQSNIENKEKIKIDLIDNIQKLISWNWMGDLQLHNSPSFNLKKIYGFDVNKNSGFYKTNSEKFIEFIKDHQIFTVFATALGIILTALGIIKLG